VKSALKYVAIPLFAFLGGFAAQLLLTVAPSIASSAGYVSQQPIFIMGPDNQTRLQMGTYTGAGERGLPLIGLSDNNGQLRMLMRLAGGNESPVLIMKDNSGRDRLVMGLALNGSKQAPFLTIVDGEGQLQNVFGKY
jgi:hypothetical protein